MLYIMHVTSRAAVASRPLLRSRSSSSSRRVIVTPYYSSYQTHCNFRKYDEHVTTRSFGTLHYNLKNNDGSGSESIKVYQQNNWLHNNMPFIQIASSRRLYTDSTSSNNQTHVMNENEEDNNNGDYDLLNSNKNSTSSSTTTIAPSQSSSSNTSISKKSIPPSAQKTLEIAIVGPPNAGKSQLLNTMIHSKVAAVSRKQHTTRGKITGIRTIDDTQLIFIDTPGFLRFTSNVKNLDKSMISMAQREMTTCDLVLVVIDAAKSLNDDLKESFAHLFLQAIHKTPTGRFAVVLNKVDLVNPKNKLFGIAEEIAHLAEACLNYDGTNDVVKETTTPSDLFPDFFMVSALHDDGVDDVVDYLTKKASHGEWLVDDGEQTTEMTPIERIAEIIREKIYRCTHREVPHQVYQINRAFRVVKARRANGKELKNAAVGVRIDQDLVVASRSHRKIILGRGGFATLRRIEDAARRDIETMLGVKVQLTLNVKHSKSEHIRRLTDGHAAETMYGNEIFGEEEG